MSGEARVVEGANETEIVTGGEVFVVTAARNRVNVGAVLTFRVDPVNVP